MYVIVAWGLCVCVCVCVCVYPVFAAFSSSHQDRIEIARILADRDHSQHVPCSELNQPHLA